MRINQYFSAINISTNQIVEEAKSEEIRKRINSELNFCTYATKMFQNFLILSQNVGVDWFVNCTGTFLNSKTHNLAVLMCTFLKKSL